MNREQLKDLFESMTPDEAQKRRMRQEILAFTQETESPPKRKFRWKGIRIAISALCLITVWLLFVQISFEDKMSAYGIHIMDADGTMFKLLDHENVYEDLGTSVSNVSSSPELEFYIDGENIAKIEISTENEYIYSWDWTETGYGIYWNDEYYQYYKDEEQVLVNNFTSKHAKRLIFTFDESFDEYERIMYRWIAWDLQLWAGAEERRLGSGISVQEIWDNMTEEEAARVRAGGEGLGMGHIQVEGYPEHLLEDIITITITGQDGEQLTKYIHVTVSNNLVRKTVVTAKLVDELE